jgi:nucleotide-binding universal stress UspA family protein
LIRLAIGTVGMAFLVPFDGSPLADAALDRAVDYAGALDTDVVAVSLVPTGADYAVRRLRVDPKKDFAAETAASDLRRKIEEATDDAELNYEDVSAYSANELSETIRRVARDVDAEVVFLGSADTDDVVVPISELDDADAYDVHIVRRT